MKPFTFMTVVAVLFTGYLFAGRATHVIHHHGVVHPGDRAHSVVAVGYAPDLDDDREDADDREEAEGLPVRIVPGTRVTEAEILPPKRSKSKPKPRAARGEATPPPTSQRKEATVALATTREIAGRLSATAERARDDARLQLEREVTVWLTPEVPTHWKPPASLLLQMIRKTEVHPIAKEYGTVYEATLEAEFSPRYRDRLLGAYRREVIAQRLVVLGGALGFILACLAALAGYIRADEATQGYYTHWLRAVAAAGIGASGVLIYQFLT